MGESTRLCLTTDRMGHRLKEFKSETTDMSGEQRRTAKNSCGDLGWVVLSQCRALSTWTSAERRVCCGWEGLTGGGAPLAAHALCQTCLHNWWRQPIRGRQVLRLTKTCHRCLAPTVSPANHPKVTANSLRITVEANPARPLLLNRRWHVTVRRLTTHWIVCKLYLFIPSTTQRPLKDNVWPFVIISLVHHFGRQHGWGPTVQEEELTNSFLFFCSQFGGRNVHRFGLRVDESGDRFAGSSHGNSPELRFGSEDTDRHIVQRWRTTDRRFGAHCRHTFSRKNVHIFHRFVGQTRKLFSRAVVPKALSLSQDRRHTQWWRLPLISRDNLF